MDSIQALGNTGFKDNSAYFPIERTKEKTPRIKNLKVLEAEYWEKYYDYPDKVYEWHNGFLEEKLMSQIVTYQTYRWYLKLIEFYLETNQIADLAGLEMAFRMDLPGEVDIRKPDLGVVLKTNPVKLELHDSSYGGIFDICIEAISDSKKTEIERDTITKKAEYAQAGVKEYTILDGNKRYTEFYRLEKRGVYVPIKRKKGDIIKSNVLPGFQFRVSDLYDCPLPELMIKDPVYQKFVLPGYTKEKQRAEKAERRAEAEAQRAEAEAQRAKKAEQRAEAEAQRAERLAQILREQGIDPDQF